MAKKRLQQATATCNIIGHDTSRSSDVDEIESSLISGAPMVEEFSEPVIIKAMKDIAEDIATHEDSTARSSEQVESLTIENKRLLKKVKSLEKDSRDMCELVKVNDALDEVKFESLTIENERLLKKVKSLEKDSRDNKVCLFEYEVVRLKETEAAKDQVRLLSENQQKLELENKKLQRFLKQVVVRLETAENESLAGNIAAPMVSPLSSKNKNSSPSASPALQLSS